jgi:hypothetical protein
MLHLDFAFFNLLEGNRRGLIYQKALLERLAPVFFSPRIKNLIDLPELDARGCNILLPLGPGNLNLLSAEQQKKMFGRYQNLVDDMNVKHLAVDRKMKPLINRYDTETGAVYGDNFIKALASVLIKKTLSKKDIQKIIMVGEVEQIQDLIQETAELGVPVSIQNQDPTRHEIFAYKLIYNTGHAISTSYINPYNWSQGDLILLFDNSIKNLTIALPELFILNLTDDSSGLSPELEDKFKLNGINHKLSGLAPVVETCLLAKAGFELKDEEKENTLGPQDPYYSIVEETGNRIGLWDLFLTMK